MYKIILIVLQYSNFFHFGGGGGRSWIPRSQKPQVGNSTPLFIFKIIGIINSLYILLIYSLIQNFVNLCFFFNSVWYFWFVARKFRSLYVSNYNISAADTEPMNNHEIWTPSEFSGILYFLYQQVCRLLNVTTILNIDLSTINLNVS